MKWLKIIGGMSLLAGCILLFCDFRLDKIVENKEAVVQIEKEDEPPYFGILEIEKINFKKEFFEIDNINNNVDKNLFVVENSVFPGGDSSNVIIAGHSGTGKNAYFRYLYKLREKDILKLYYNNNLYIYEINDIEYQDKTGTLYLKQEKEDMLTLITCTLNDKKHQTIYYAKLKDVSKIS